MTLAIEGAEAARRTKIGGRRLWLAAAMAGSALTAAGAAHADEAACKALNGQAYPASAMSLPSAGAVINSADWVAAKPNFGAYCKLQGQINSVDPKATPILFEINLPADWNKKVMQEGGGGLNGVLVQATGILRDAPPGSAPLAHGYATLGTDGGHPNLKPEIGVFYLNAEEFVNNAYGANKKAHDLAWVVLNSYYGEKPQRSYFFGGSEGGRQAMVGVEKYPQDYDGVVAVVPALNSTANNLAKYNAWQAILNDGWLSKAKLQFLQKATNDQCDAMDGVKDGVVSRYVGCLAVFNYAKLRCADGKDTGDDCLSDKQITAVKTWRNPYKLPVAMKNGMTVYPGWSVGGEALPGSVNPWIVLDTREDSNDAGTAINASQSVRYGVTENADYRGPIDFKKYADRIKFVSNLMDQTNPDLSGFLARGGKLIVKENTADYAVSPYGVFDFFKQVSAKMGAAKTHGFIRIFVNPGVNHGGSGLRADGTAVPDKVDLLAELDKWVDGGPAPEQLTVTSYSREGQAQASKPLCQYPMYPRYKAGDANDAASFTCTPLPAAGPAKAPIKAVKTAKAETAAKPAAKKG